MDTQINDVQIKALVDHIRTCFKYKDDPSIICQKSRVTCEYILALIWNNEFKEYPTGKMMQSLCDGIIKNRPSLIPIGIQTLIGTIQTYGNKTSHAQENLEQLNSTHSIIVESALGELCNWFFITYLNTNPAPDFKPTDESLNAQISSYRELLNAIFSDGVLELDEYEKIIDARESLNLDIEQFKQIETEVLNKHFKESINDIIELLKPTDLRNFAQKNKDKTYGYPTWVVKAIEDITKKSDLPNYAMILSDYFNEVPNENKIEIPICIKHLGCWQGWYMQSQEFQMKTYYDLTFVALSKDEFIGLSLEPLNPNWWSTPQISSDILFASINGNIENDIIISFQKEYLFENSWQIDYQAVITEEGKYFEGDWEIRHLSGPFNAIKTRSLLPIHVYNIDTNQPVTKIKYINKLKNLTSTWFFQLTGKESVYGLIHMVELNEMVHANLLYIDTEKVNLSYLNGNYDSNGNIILSKQSDILGETSNLFLRFAVDWSINELNGTVKDEVYKMRALKGFKL